MNIPHRPRYGKFVARPPRQVDSKQEPISSWPHFWLMLDSLFVFVVLVVMAVSLRRILLDIPMNWQELAFTCVAVIVVIMLLVYRRQVEAEEKYPRSPPSNLASPDVARATGEAKDTQDE